MRCGGGEEKEGREREEEKGRGRERGGYVNRQREIDSRRQQKESGGDRRKEKQQRKKDGQRGEKQPSSGVKATLAAIWPEDSVHADFCPRSDRFHVCI